LPQPRALCLPTKLVSACNHCLLEPPAAPVPLPAEQAKAPWCNGSASRRCAAWGRQPPLAAAAAASAPLCVLRAACSLQHLRVPLHVCAHAHTHAHHMGGHARLPAGEQAGCCSLVGASRTWWVLELERTKERSAWCNSLHPQSLMHCALCATHRPLCSSRCLSPSRCSAGSCCRWRPPTWRTLCSATST